jgi:transposase-like protein
MTKKASMRHAPEVRDRAVQMVFEHQDDHASKWTAIGSIAAKIGRTDDSD